MSMLEKKAHILYLKIRIPCEEKRGIWQCTSAATGDAVTPVCVSSLCVECLDQWEGRNRRLGKQLVQAGIIGSALWQRFITCLSKCISERLTSSTGALDCTAEKKRQDTEEFSELSEKKKKLPRSWLTWTTDVHQNGLGTPGSKQVLFKLNCVSKNPGNGGEYCAWPPWGWY